MGGKPEGAGGIGGKLPDTGGFGGPGGAGVWFWFIKF